MRDQDVEGMTRPLWGRDGTRWREVGGGEWKTVASDGFLSDSRDRDVFRLHP